MEQKQTREQDPGQEMKTEQTPERKTEGYPEQDPEQAREQEPGTRKLWDRLTAVPLIRGFLEIPLIRKVLNRETVLYIAVGVLTTLVDYLVFALVNELLKTGGMNVTDSSSAATAAAWAAAVIFAYFTNKIYVFESKDWQAGTLVREVLQFFGARVLSGLITLWLMRVLVGAQMNEYLAKILTSVFNLVFNYVASKLLIFRKKASGNG